MYHYDRAGHLIAETTDTGERIRDYIWAASRPVAQIDVTGGTEHITYLHTDHLATPRQGSAVEGRVVWQWPSDAFGASPANDDPDGDGTAVTVNLRFPGQYYDQETGLHYNWHRYYDPKTGRYITSDPIGLLSGINSYSYVSQNPLRRVDPFGTVEWEGTITGGAFLTAGGFVFDLKSKCVNGKRGVATVVLAGAGLGLGAVADISFSGSNVQLEDSLNIVAPLVFHDTALDGGFITTVGFAIPPTPEQDLGRRLAGVKGNPPHGYGCAAIRLGAAGGIGCGPIWGFDISAGIIVGSSTVVSSRVESCCEQD